MSINSKYKLHKVTALPSTPEANQLYFVSPLSGNTYQLFATDNNGVARSLEINWGNISGLLTNQTDLQNALNARQPLDADLTAIAGLTGTGLLRKTGVDAWSLDSNTYLTSIPAATTTVLGGVRLFSDTVQTVASNAVTATASRTYGVQLNSSGQMVVNVPWTDTVYTHPTQTAIDVTTSGANIISRVTVNTLGHTTAVEQRTLTLANLGYTGATNADNYGSWLLAAGGVSGTQSITSGGTATFSATSPITVSRTGATITYGHANSGVAAGTYNNVTVNALGHVTGGSNVAYLTSFTETDPTVPSHVKAITTTNISNWNTAFGWGNHAAAGYAFANGSNATGTWGINITGNSATTSAISGTTNFLAKFTGAGTIGNSLIFDNGTNVGINTTNTIQRLTVNGNILAEGVGNGFLLDTLGVQFSNGMRVVNNFETVVYSGRGSAGYLIAGDNNIRFGFSLNYSAGEAMRITSGGNVLIGTTSELTGGGSLQVAGDGRFTGDVIAFSLSDQRLKDNIKRISDPIEKVLKLGGYSFIWNDKQNTYTGMDYGVIAQEVEAVFPEIVQTRDNGYKAVEYEKLIPVLIEAVKELSKEIKELKGK